ncbi:hypothetical protein [Glaciibacter superstes]|uniref:hypothetical protein n=1 Tax=Glaciibacter superstes TaxID=501023 RepID=UPI0003B35A1B|nr:hypothetical protein [Glaciibacter superstes]
MTLGNDPQSETPPLTPVPLTRRQARERARDQDLELSPEQQAAEKQAAEQQAAERQAANAAPKPSRRAGTDSAIQAGDTPEFITPQAHVEAASVEAAPAISPARAASTTPVSSFAPRSATTQIDPAPQGMPTPERTLTRRELRAMKAMEDAETGAQQVIDDGASETANDAPDGHPSAWNGDRGVDPSSHSDSHTQVIDGGQPFDQLISRGVGAGGIPTTSNALILPSVPQQGTRSGPLTSTGEILITGSIDLPRSLGATGQHPNHFDSSEMDHMLDQLDEGTATSSVAPVSASRAVSTHTSTRGVMTPPKKSGVSLPSVLAITAAVLAAGVVALFIVGYMLKIF